MRIGRQGGQTTKQKLGREHYVRIGRIGGTHRHAAHTSEEGGEAE
jgi:hypothetical protein